MPAFDVLLRQSATIYPKTGRDRYGKPTFGAGVVYACRFDGNSNTKYKADEQEQVFDAKMVIDNTAVVKLADKVLGPDGLNYRIGNLNVVPDKFGDTHHIELDLLKWPI